MANQLVVTALSQLEIQRSDEKTQWWKSKPVAHTLHAILRSPTIHQLQALHGLCWRPLSSLFTSHAIIACSVVLGRMTRVGSADKTRGGRAQCRQFTRVAQNGLRRTVSTVPFRDGFGTGFSSYGLLVHLRLAVLPHWTIAHAAHQPSHMLLCFAAKLHDNLLIVSLAVFSVWGPFLASLKVTNGRRSQR